ncbi:MAG: hypothetical protein KDB00_07305 [Planctomycetales bacterium]|nr:hypothetical protein [Planctomycetales bacterium]
MFTRGWRGEKLGSSGFGVIKAANGVEFTEINGENLHCFSSLVLVGGANVTGNRKLPRSRVRVASFRRMTPTHQTSDLHGFFLSINSMVNRIYRRRIQWAAVIAFSVLLLAAALAWHIWSGQHVAQWQLLQHIVQIENSGVDEHNVQPFGWSLAILGRDDEIRRLDFHPQFDLPPLNVDTQKLELNAVPWRDGINQIAREHRLVMIMEDHFVSKHREMIGATLPIFQEAGFTHYAAEAIGETGAALKIRGYPVVETGYYTSDPQFGNALRCALDLNFEVLGYDFRPFTHEGREEYAASELAKLFKDSSQTRLVVHAGLAHVFKYETDLGQRWLASVLWEKTGIEPFTIWQWSAMRDGQEYHVVADAIDELGDFVEPVLLMPPPNTDCGLRNVPHVDAILVHPLDRSVAPAERTVLFPREMHRIDGKWLTEQWPVVVAAYKNAEPITAIPLDQVMMREGEQDFVLWIPSSSAYDIVVFDQNGLLDSTTENDRDSVLVRARK